MLPAILLREAKADAKFTGGLDSLLDTLNGIHLAACITQNSKRGKPKLNYQIQERDEKEQHLAQA